ncbi:MAG: hypothetical protein ACI9OU_001828 [Candidatus Promineifilaceae bacterium]
MKRLAKILMCMLCSACVVALLGAFAHGAYDRGMIDIDVSDGLGHGPDRGIEWDSAAHKKINACSALSGVVVFALIMVAARGFRAPLTKLEERS